MTSLKSRTLTSIDESLDIDSALKAEDNNGIAKDADSDVQMDAPLDSTAADGGRVEDATADTSALTSSTGELNVDAAIATMDEGDLLEEVVRPAASQDGAAESTFSSSK